MSEFQLDELKRAYELLDVPYSASARSIGKSYRRMAKRWHPDRYLSGSPAQAEATQMMKLINEAYSQIDKAPLLHQPPGTTTWKQSGSEVCRSPESFAGDSMGLGLAPLAGVVVLIVGTFVAFEFPVLVRTIEQNVKQSWVLGVLIATLVCCIAAQQFWRFRNFRRVWAVFAAYVVLHFLVAVPALGKLGRIEPFHIEEIYLVVFIIAELAATSFVLRRVTGSLPKGGNRC